jgi:hypothetical protein
VWWRAALAAGIFLSNAGISATGAHLGAPVARMPVHHEGGFIADAIEIKSKPKTVLCPMAFTKNILIINAPENVEVEGSPALDQASFVYGPFVDRLGDRRINLLRRPQSGHFNSLRSVQIELFFFRPLHWQAFEGIRNTVAWRLAIIFDDDLDVRVKPGIHFQHANVVHVEIGSQLPLGVLIGAPNQSSRRPPQGHGSSEEQESEKHQQRVGDFQPPTAEDPKLGSLIASIVAIALAFVACGRGMSVWDSGRRWAGAGWLLCGFLLAGEATFGLLLGLDLWTLLRL